MNEPIIRAIAVGCPPDVAFRVFTEEMTSWWPLQGFSLAADDEGSTVKAERVVVEPSVGGRVFEVRSDGTEATWADVLAWDPPRSLTLAWSPTADRDRVPPTEVEVTFVPEGDGTRVTLVHRGWERLDPTRATEAHASYTQGWPHVFDELFGGAADAAS